MSSLLGNFSVATTTNNVFTGTALNDILLTAQSNQKIWIGGASGASNVLSVGSNVTTTSNLEVTGLTSLSNLVITGTVEGFNGVSSNQSFSNVYSSNVYGSNAAFSNLIISSTQSNNGSLSVAGVLTSATLSNTGTLSNAGAALFSSNVGIGLATPQYPLDVVGNANFSGNISAGNITTSNLTFNANLATLASLNASNAIFQGTNSNDIALYSIAGQSVWMGNQASSNSICVSSNNGVIVKGNAQFSGPLTANGGIASPIGFRCTVFATSGNTTWTVPSNVYYIKVTGTGGGGGGGGSGFPNGTGGTPWYGSSGGGSGGTQIWYGSVTPNTTFSITVGFGGGGGAKSGNGSGGAASIVYIGAEKYVYANGGHGGKVFKTYSAPGSGEVANGASLAQISIPGASSQTIQSFIGSSGASSIWGGGGGGGDGDDFNEGLPGVVYGSGGGGARYDSLGGIGAVGVVMIEY